MMCTMYQSLIPLAFALLIRETGADLLSMDPALHYNTEEFIRAAGYLRPETHFTTTDDGYILHMARVSSNTTGPPVLIMHGLSASSDAWVFQGRKRDLAFLLVDSGYDVWLGDIRGNSYSRKHVRIPPTDPQFWEFSFHEMGKYDVPAMVDHVLRTTGYRKLSYIGHSMGTTMFFVMGSERPEYMSKINVFIGLSPVATMSPSNLSREKAMMLQFSANFLTGLQRQNFVEVPKFSWAPTLATAFCERASVTQDLCYDLIFFWVGNQAKRMSRKTLPLVLSHVPAGLSLLTPVHFIQTIASGVFRQRDLGPEGNFLRFHSNAPPRYKLSKVKCPVALFYSLGDFLINATDVKEFMGEFPNLVYTKELTDYNHIDFTWAREAWKDIYQDVIKLVRKFNRRK